MARSRELKVVIAGDSDRLDRELRKANGSLDKLGKQTRLTGTISSKGYSAMRVGATGAAAALGGLALAGKHVAAANIEAEKSEARMRAQLKASGISYGAHSAQIEKSIQATARLAAVDDEDLQDAFTNIVRVTGDVDRSLRLSGLAADIAAAKHIDVAKAGELVGKVAGGNVGILKRYGITVKEGATASEALAAVQQKFAGQAEAYGKTTGGAMDRARNSIENLEEKVGKKLAPTIEKGANKLAQFVDEMSSGTGAGGRFADTLGDIWKDAKPIVTWIGRATGNVAKFTAEHPNVGKLAAAMLGVGAAVKTLRLINAATGFSHLLKAGRGAARSLKTILSRGGTAAGEAAASGAAANFGANTGRFRDTGKKVGRAMGKGLAVGVAIAIPVLLYELGKPIRGLWRKLGREFVEHIKSAWGKVGNFVDKINPFGDGVGVGSMLRGAIGGGAAGSLQGANPALGPFAAVGRRFGLRVSSGLRRGAVTKSGNQSHHAAGNAIDMAGPPGKMLAFFRSLKASAGSRLAELIYTPGGVGIKNGRPHRYTGAVAADHYDHVHVAYTGGGRGPQGLRGDGIGVAVRAARAAGLSGSKLVNMVAIAGAESGYNPKINAAGPEDSRGLWQINVGPNANPDMLKFGNLYDPYVNAKAMKIILGRQGLGAWTVYRTGAYKAYLARARRAVVGTRGSAAKTTAGRGGSRNTLGPGRVAQTPAPAVSAYEQDLATADVGVAEAEGGSIAAQVGAHKARGAVVSARLQKVTTALRKKGLRPATRLRLTQERASLLGELRSIDSTMRELNTPPDTGEDPNQALIDAIEAKAQQDREIAEEQARIAEEHRQYMEAHATAIREAKEAIDQQNKIAASTVAIGLRQAQRALGDMISGELGTRAGNRAMMPGSGQLASVGNGRY